VALFTRNLIRPKNRFTSSDTAIKSVVTAHHPIVSHVHMFLLDVYLVVDIKITNICKSVIKEYIYVHYELKSLYVQNQHCVFKKNKILEVVLPNFRQHATA
jgi:hypothetical protein